MRAQRTTDPPDRDQMTRPSDVPRSGNGNVTRGRGKGILRASRKAGRTLPDPLLRRADRAARGRLALNPQTQEPIEPVLASVEASTFTIPVLVWNSHEFADRGVSLEFAPNLHRRNAQSLLPKLQNPYFLRPSSASHARVGGSQSPHAPYLLTGGHVSAGSSGNSPASSPPRSSTCTSAPPVAAQWGSSARDTSFTRTPAVKHTVGCSAVEGGLSLHPYGVPLSLTMGISPRSWLPPPPSALARSPTPWMALKRSSSSLIRRHGKFRSRVSTMVSAGVGTGRDHQLVSGSKGNTTCVVGIIRGDHSSG